jgi:FKBP-type peptidyl-prolyl cis-trans isomerase FklB
MGIYPQNNINTMKIKLRRVALFSGVLFLMGSAACAQMGDKKNGGSGEAGEMKDQMDSISYVFGSSLGANIRQSGIEDVNTNQVMAGLEDAMEGDSGMVISTEEGQTMVRSFMQKQQKQKAAEAMDEANAYMEKMAEGDMQSTASGIYYEVIEEGDGEKPEATDRVKVNYEGKTTDGEVFDSSYERGKPAEFPLNRVIPGWTEILQLMPVGSTWKAVFPPSLAYGERGSPPNIGPNEVLIFKIELIDILPPKEKKGMQPGNARQGR